MNNERIEEIKKYAEAEVVLSYPFNIFAEYCLDLIETIERLKTALEFYADEEHWGMIDGVSYLKGADQWIAKDALEGNTP